MACASACTSGSVVGELLLLCRAFLTESSLHPFYKREEGDRGIQVQHADVRLAQSAGYLGLLLRLIYCAGELWPIARHLYYLETLVAKLRCKVCNTLVVSIVAIKCLKWVFSGTEDLYSDQICRTISEMVWEPL